MKKNIILVILSFVPQLDYYSIIVLVCSFFSSFLLSFFLSLHLLLHLPASTSLFFFFQKWLNCNFLWQHLARDAVDLCFFGRGRNGLWLRTRSSFQQHVLKVCPAAVDLHITHICLRVMISRGRRFILAERYVLAQYTSSVCNIYS